MSMQDPIADLLTRIRNALMVKFEKVSAPSSRIKAAIARVLFEQGYIEHYEVSEGAKPILTIVLKYHEGMPVIRRLQRISRPGLRTYKEKSKLPRVLGGLGIAIVSTSKGVMSNIQAKQMNQGGEVLCTVE